MLDVGRELAEAIYFLQYTIAQILWAIDRSLLTIAVIAENANIWLTTNVGYFVELLTNGLAGPMGALFIFALTLLGVWFLLNNIVPTKRPVDPQKLLTYGFMTFFFFATPTLVIEMLEGLRQAATAGVQQSLLDAAQGSLFGDDLGGTDTGMPNAIPDVYPAGDGAIGSFDLVAYFLSMGNLAELDNVEFPALFAATYFPFGDPSTINLTDEADREAAKRLAAEGIQRLFFALIAIPTAIADHFLRLSLTGAAVLLYLGAPFAMMLAFFVYTESFIGAYLRQFINLLIETFLSVIIAAIVIGMLAVAAQQGMGAYIGAGIIAGVILIWRIQGALKLALNGMNLFGGGVLTGGATGRELVNMGRNTALAGAGLGLAAATGGGSLALAGLLRADGRAEGGYLGTDPEKADGRARQLEALAGYALGQSRTARNVIEGVHEARTFGRNFRDGGTETYEPDTLDYLRVGSSLSHFGSSPWVATRTSAPLNAAYGQIGGYGVGRARARGGDRDRGRGRDGGRDRDGGEGEDRGRDIDRDEDGDRDGDGGAAARRGGGWRTDGAARAMADGTAGDRDDWLAAPDERFVTGAPPTGDTAAPTTNAAAADTADTALTTPDIRLASPSEAQRMGLLGLAGNLVGPAAGPTQRILEEMVGAEKARQVETAVTEHGVAAVTAAMTAILDRVTAAAAAGETPQTLWSSFRDGRALPDSPLSREQLAAVADTVLQPRRAVSQVELVEEIGKMAAAGGGDDRDLAARLGSPTHFGTETGAVRALLEGVTALRLTGEQLREMAAALRAGESAETHLSRQGYAPGAGRAFARDLAGVEAGVLLPQTTAQPATAQPAATQSRWTQGEERDEA